MYKPADQTEPLAWFRFHGDLNDFLSGADTAQPFVYSFKGQPAIKDPIEVFGVPHTEVGLIVVNEQAVSFAYRLKPGDHVSVYPITAQAQQQSTQQLGSVRLRESLDAPVRFVVDTNLGKLARYLRLLGFDALYDNAYEDGQVARISAESGRVLLTRDRRLLQRKIILYGAWIRSDKPDRQVFEVLKRFGLFQSIQPMKRCAVCNGLIQMVNKQAVLSQLEPLTRRHYNRFYQCSDCGKVFWKGSHYQKIVRKLEQLVEGASSEHSDRTQ